MELSLDIEMPSHGFGPWFVALAFNIVADPKKKTLILMHTDPDFILKYINRDESGVSAWVTVLTVGPFECDEHAKVFKAKWATGPRPRPDRLTWGTTLCHKYFESLDLSIWYKDATQQILTLEEIAHLENLKQRIKHIRKARRGKITNIRQVEFELLPDDQRDVTLGATKHRQEIREEKLKVRKKRKKK